MKNEVIENFLTRKECRHIIQLCKDRVHNSMSPVADGNGGFKPVPTNSLCNNLITWLPPTYDPIIKAISERISKKIGYGLEYFAQIQILKYETGGYYKMHLDNSYDDNPQKITFQIYLNNVEEGGETNFPQQNLSFKPKMGRAVMWYNFEDDAKAAQNASLKQTAEPETVHEGALITKGEKWGFTQWIKLRPVGTPDPLKVQQQPQAQGQQIPAPTVIANPRVAAAPKVIKVQGPRRKAGSLTATTATTTTTAAGAGKKIKS